MNRLTCREFDEVVHGLVRMELLDVALREEALDHAACCSNCAERMIEARMLAEATEAAANSVREQEAPQNVEAVLLSAFRNRRHRTVWWRRLEWLAAGASAAVLLFVLWASSARPKEQPSPVPKNDISSQSKQPLDAQASPQDDLGATVATEITTAPTVGTLSADEFVPVPFTDGIGPEDEGMVVRVQLTRASLAELGYPVAETPDDDLIQADVLVGEDGWPRAVRVVQ